MRGKCIFYNRSVSDLFISCFPYCLGVFLVVLSLFVNAFHMKKFLPLFNAVRIDIYLVRYILLLPLSRFSRVRLCDPIDSSPPGSPVPGILQARTLEWAAISFSNACMRAKVLQSCPTLQPHGQQPTRLLCPRDSLGKNTGLGCHFLLPDISYLPELHPSVPILSFAHICFPISLVFAFWFTLFSMCLWCTECVRIFLIDELNPFTFIFKYYYV